ncbi:MAG: M14 family zinc carboxypeptidase [bacterium]|nr:M14 family zinc carboxypeptidase [bacterium]
MKKSILLSFIVIFCLILFPREIVKISYDDFLRIKDSVRDLDIVGYQKENFVELNLSLYQASEMKRMGIDMQSSTKSDSKGEYLTLEEYYHLLDSLALKYDSICSLETLGFTYNNRPLVIMKINGVNPDEYQGQNAFLLMAEHHAREWQTIPLAFFFAESLMASFESDSAVAGLLNSNFIVVYPMVNPDGYHYSHDDFSGDNYWRKNRAYRVGNYGVDLNRNYDGGCNRNISSDWGYPSGISLNPTDEYLYAGPYPASEVETKSVKKLITDYDFNISISVHSYAQALIYPWGSLYSSTEDDSLIISVAEKIAGGMRTNDGVTTYDYYRSAEMYPTTGDSDDWIYGWTKRVKGKTTIPYTLEVDVSFQPSTATLDSLYRRLYPGLLKAAFLCDSVEGNAKEMPLKPELSMSGDDSLFWTGVNKENADYYTIYIEDAPQSVTDFYNDTSKYDFTYASVDSTEYYSSFASLHPWNVSASASVVKLRERIRVKENDSLTFYMKYDLSSNNDFLFPEISEDDNLYKPIDTLARYTGTDATWKRYAINLDDWVGKDVYIRFRALFSGYPSSFGVYIDNVDPVTDSTFTSEFASGVTDTFIELTFDPYASDNYLSVLPHAPLFGNTVNSKRFMVGIAGLYPSIKDTTKLDEMKIYFDAKAKILNLKIFSNDEQEIKFKVVRADGAILLCRTITAQREASVDVSFLKSGKYFVTADGKKTTKSGFMLIK